MASIDREISEISRKATEILSSSDEWKTILAELERRYRKTFDGRSLDDDVDRIMILVKFRIGLCLVEEGLIVVEAVEYYKQVSDLDWSIGFDGSSRAGVRA